MLVKQFKAVLKIAYKLSQGYSLDDILLLIDDAWEDGETNMLVKQFKAVLKIAYKLSQGYSLDDILLLIDDAWEDGETVTGKMVSDFLSHFSKDK